MSRLISSACFLALFFPLFASGFVSSVKCPEPFSYCTSQQDCPLPNRLRHDGKDYMACIYNATSAIRIGVCCTDIAEDLYFDFETFDNLLSKKLIRTKRLKRQAEETSPSDLPAPPDGSMIEKSIESIPQGSLENKEDGQHSGRAEHTPAESTSKSPEKASGGSADRKHPPQRRPPQHSNRYSLPGYSGRPRGNIPKRRKMYINIPKPKPPRQPKPSQQSKPTAEPNTPKKQKQEQPEQEQEKKQKPRRPKNQSRPKAQKASKPHFNRESNRPGGPSPNNKNNSGNRGNKTPPNNHQTKPGRGTSKPPAGQSNFKKTSPPNQNRRKNQTNVKQPKQNQGQKKGPRRGPH
ncbi:unnamed protein product [Allacma fusca]|uniref:Uncharacterized protein n=1 Tax=Allacma fusca TaxID=39272 RepID=A0A8J2LIK0_9HEXA|nr:unnamed protein product [Allacma fusca]